MVPSTLVTNLAVFPHRDSSRLCISEPSVEKGCTMLVGAPGPP